MHNVEEAHAVAQELLADALAGRVDGDLNVGARIHERGDKEAHGDGLAKAPRRRDEDLLVDRGPAVELEQPRVALRKEPRRVRLEEDAHDGVDEALVEEPLVVRALPPAAVQRHERLPQLFQAREAVAPRLRGVRRAVFEERVEPPEALANVLARHGGARRELLRGLPARPGQARVHQVPEDVGVADGLRGHVCWAELRGVAWGCALRIYLGCRGDGVLCVVARSMKSNLWASGDSRTPTPHYPTLLGTQARKISGIGT